MPFILRQKVFGSFLIADLKRKLANDHIDHQRRKNVAYMYLVFGGCTPGIQVFSTENKNDPTGAPIVQRGRVWKHSMQILPLTLASMDFHGFSRRIP